MTDTCASFRNNIPAMLLGDPEFTLQDELLAHAGECPACAREIQGYQATIGQIRAIPDLPVPRHFFVYGESAAKSPWMLFRQLQPGWKVAMLANAAAVFVMATLLITGMQMRYESGSFALSFGKPIESPAYPSRVDVATLKAELSDAMDAKLVAQNQAWKAAMRIEFTQLGTALSDRQKDLLQASLARLENRVNDRILTTQTALQGGTEKALDNMYQLLRFERQQDVIAITDRIDVVAAHSEAKASQTDAVLSTLLDVAEQRVKN
jgi:hypothetical protein